MCTTLIIYPIWINNGLLVSSLLPNPVVPSTRMRIKMKPRCLLQTDLPWKESNLDQQKWWIYNDIKTRDPKRIKVVMWMSEPVLLRWIKVVDWIKIVTNILFVKSGFKFICAFLVELKSPALGFSRSQKKYWRSTYTFLLTLNINQGFQGIFCIN